MHTAVIICEDSERSRQLQIVCEQTKGVLRVTTHPDVDEARRCHTSEASRVGVVILSLLERDGTGLHDEHRASFHAAKDHFTKSHIVIELSDDRPDLAFEFLNLGAYNVVSRIITRAEQIWDVVLRALAQNAPYGTLFHSEDVTSGWGFMSMPFDPGDVVNADYRLAVVPAFNRLGLSAPRMDEMPRAMNSLREHALREIKLRKVLVGLVSTTTLNTMYEVGIADALDKPLLLLWRSDGIALPALLQGLRFIEYNTRTELAMKLYFGLRQSIPTTSQHSANHRSRGD